MTEPQLARTYLSKDPAVSESSHVVPSGSKSALKHPHFGVSPAKLWAALLFRWKSALFVGIVFAVAGVAIAWITYEPKYTAVASMRVHASKPRLLAGVHANSEETANREIDFQKIQAQLVRSREVLDAVLKRDQIRGLPTIHKLESPHLWLEKELQASFITGTDIFRIGLSGENPQDIAAIVNAVQSVYIEQFVTHDKNHQAARVETIESVMTKAEWKIREKRAELRAQAELLKTGDPQALTLRQKMALDDFAAMKRELATIESDIRRTQALLSVMRFDLKDLKAESQKLPEDLIKEYIASHPLVQKELVEINQRELKIKDYAKLVTPESTRLRELNEDLTATKEHLEKLKVDLRPEVIKKARADMTHQKAVQLGQAMEKKRVLNEQKQFVEAEAGRLGKIADDIGKGSFDIELLRAVIDDAGVTLKMLRAEKERLDIEKYNTRDAVEAEQKAEVPTVNQASLLKAESMWGVGGLLLGLFCVSFLEARLHRIHKSTEVARELGLQTLGVLPLFQKETVHNYGRALGIDQSLDYMVFADAIQNLCSKLACDDRLGKNAVIMISSADDNEGKTTLATQMAIGLAHTGRKTLLLDCDFRKPNCHDQLGLEASPGLCELLSGEVDLHDALQTVPESEARLITVGKWDHVLVKALSNGTFAALLARLRQDFDTIIIDSAPMLRVADGFVVGKMVDGVLLVVRSAVSKGPDVFAAYEQLTALKIPVLGAVVNGSRRGFMGSFYYPRKEAGKATKDTQV